jgi:hypothetical protein
MTNEEFQPIATSLIKNASRVVQDIAIYLQDPEDTERKSLVFKELEAIKGAIATIESKVQ